jgi:ABC-2 type transport system ATP-binding protein
VTSDRSDAAISFDSVGKEFDGRWIVRELDVDIAAGTIVGFIGPSGCGKTTAVRLTTGVYRPSAGSVTVLGRHPTELRTAERVAIGYLPQQPVLFDELSVMANLRYHAGLNGVGYRRRRRLTDVLDLVELDGEESKRVRDISGGMQRRLALAGALVHEPPIAILDEPTAGIDPILRRKFWEHFRAMRDDGRTVVVTTQHVDEAIHCDRVVVLSEGEVIDIGTPSELRRRAFGGDPLDLTISTIADDVTVGRIGDLDGVVRATVTGPRSVRVILADGSGPSREFGAELESIGVGVTESSEPDTDWNEIFIELMRSEEVTSESA